jgi:hypothetical protein
MTEQNNTSSEGRVELPVVVAEETNKHVSLLLVEDGLAQVEEQLKTIDSGLMEANESSKQLNERVTMLQSRKIAAIAQKNLLAELQKKIAEFSGASQEQG